MRRVLILFGVCILHAQTTSPSFEVATIKPNHSESGNSSTSGSRGQLTMENQSLKRLIERAWDVRDFSFSGPGWLDTVRFDLVAKPPAGTAPDQFLPMLQTLLTERFKLAIHREKRTVTGYALVVAKGGPKFVVVDGATPGGTSTGRGRLEAKSSSVPVFADMLARQLDQPVQDMTNLAGLYNLKLEWTPDEASPEGPTLFTALQEQLGLKLQPQKIMIDVLVVDSAERIPTEN
jgi:uncharacterized protein (TIGR03435 family)